jgi:hypothetical protein
MITLITSYKAVIPCKRLQGQLFFQRAAVDRHGAILGKKY